MTSYLSAVRAHLGSLSSHDRHLVMETLEAQLSELTEAGITPVQALGTPADYAHALLDALADDTDPTEPRFRILGLPTETRGATSARVRSRTWNPANPRLVVPRLLGIGWTLNLGALAVRLRLIRPDDATSDIIDQIPESAVRAAQAAPLAMGSVGAGVLAFAWTTLPKRVPSSFGVLGRHRRTSPRTSMLATLALGIAPAWWALRRQESTEERLVSAASAATLAAVSASAIAATVLSARSPRGRWGFLVPAGLTLGVLSALGVVVLPLRAGLHRAWRTAGISGPRNR